MFDGMSMFYYIKDLKFEIYSLFNKFLFFMILIPIIINTVTLYLLEIIIRNGEISIAKAKNLLPSILNRYINYLIKVTKNKELLSYYIGRCKAELVFYLIILILYFLLLNFCLIIKLFQLFN